MLGILSDLGSRAVATKDRGRRWHCGGVCSREASGMVSIGCLDLTLVALGEALNMAVERGATSRMDGQSR